MAELDICLDTILRSTKMNYGNVQLRAGVHVAIRINKLHMEGQENKTIGGCVCVRRHLRRIFQRRTYKYVVIYRWIGEK